MKSTITPDMPLVNAQSIHSLDVSPLLDRLRQITDTRGRKGRRYPLSWLLLLIILAKLCGEDRPSGIADWVAGRHKQWREHLHLDWLTMPHHSTYRRILEHVVKPDEIDHLVSEVSQGKHGADHIVLIAMDGKTLRGTIGRDHPRGEHLLSAYLPDEGIVLGQRAMSEKSNEITEAPALLKDLHLEGKVVAADAMHTQRELSTQILDSGGEYLWVAKGNQPTLLGDIEYLFNSDRTTTTGGRVPDDFESYKTCDKGHGRLEVRKITTSGMLAGYVEWPGLEQVFRLRRERTDLKTGKMTCEVVYGLTSLSRQEASASRLLELVRRYWGIENGLHNRRDVTFQEDRCRLTLGSAGRVVASINNLIISLLNRAGHRNIAQGRRLCDASLPYALNLITACLIT